MSEYQDPDRTGNRYAFGFVQALAEELTAGKVRLPSSPEAALRLQRALSAEEVDPAVVVSAAGAEPALAMRVMRMANSALLNPMGREVRDLKTAIARVGYNMVRSAAVAFVLEQLREAEHLDEATKSRLTQLWQEGIRVAAFSSVIARQHTRLNPDVAMLAGLLQGVGKLCILIRIRELPALQGYPETCERLLREWHAGVARAVVQSWSLSEEVADAVEACHDLDRELSGPVVLADVLSAALVLAAVGDGGNVSTARARHFALFDHIGLDVAACEAILAEAVAQVGALQAALAA